MNAFVFQKTQWRTFSEMENVSYNLDFSSCSHLFGSLKKIPGGEKLENDIQVEGFVSNWLNTQPTIYNTDIKKLPTCWQKCL